MNLEHNDPVRVLEEQNAHSRLQAMDQAQFFLDANPDITLPATFTELKRIIAAALRNVQMAGAERQDTDAR